MVINCINTKMTGRFILDPLNSKTPLYCNDEIRFAMLAIPSLHSAYAERITDVTQPYERHLGVSF